MIMVNQNLNKTSKLTAKLSIQNKMFSPPANYNKITHWKTKINENVRAEVHKQINLKVCLLSKMQTHKPLWETSRHDNRTSQILDHNSSQALMSTLFF